MATDAVETTDLELLLIIIDAELQPRESMDLDRVTQYAEDMLAGVTFPPVRVYRVSDRDGRLYLTSGFHRYHGAEQAGMETIPAEVIEGTFAEAKWDAAGSNKEFDRNTEGKKRLDADKRRAIEMAWRAMPSSSQGVIAGHVGVTQGYVSKVLSVLTHSRNGSTPTIGIDGIARRVPFVPTERVVEWVEPSREPDDPPRHDPLPGQEELPFRIDVLPQAIATETKPAARPTFNQTNEMVDWARWTWNPVTGCEHNCVYCYARDIANRFYAEKFEPTYRPERLDAPRYTRLPGAAAIALDPIEQTSWRNVFVCSMADLFGRWVPDEWITSVFDSCRQSPEWNYLFLTKFPQRYVGLDFPETAWVGTSIDEQKRVPNAEKAFRKIKVPVRWLSVEPMREPIKFNDLSMFDWVVIGGQSRSSGAPEFFPDTDWVRELIHHARQAGCKVYCKPNTDPGNHWAGLYKQYPSAFGAE